MESLISFQVVYESFIRLN